MSQIFLRIACRLAKFLNIEQPWTPVLSIQAATLLEIAIRSAISTDLPRVYAETSAA
ncbi:hypothetical protein PWG14_28085 [Chromobacterium amazonense]|uniref:hypothetical protein n=1 Tax=Chromobacterium amazonense TaxID=1382803 RepID=UPI00237E370B|nr:hypothetical protein [Chromobacterium amazonense]MDE1716331.1 hypothetical protein [Chromobacterium amazonense]